MSWQDLRSEVEQHDGVLTVQMDQLRILAEAGKLGPHVRRAIGEELAKHGLGHVPRELPRYSYEQVRLYLNGTPAARLIRQVLEVGPANDQLLRDRLTSDSSEHAELIAQIRELVAVED